MSGVGHRGSGKEDMLWGSTRMTPTLKHTHKKEYVYMKCTVFSFMFLLLLFTYIHTVFSFMFLLFFFYIHIQFNDMFAVFFFNYFFISSVQFHLLH